MKYTSNELDITFCCNEECTKRKECLRGQQKKLSKNRMLPEYVSIANFVYNESCMFFIPIKKEI